MGPTTLLDLLPYERAVRALSRAVPADVLFGVDTRAPAVALTVDDGPHPGTTPAVLDVLAGHGARATFFLQGDRVRRYPMLVRRIAAGGHELANHLMRDEPSVLLPDAEFRRQLAEVTSLLEPHGPVRHFRPGSGWFTPRMLAAAGEQGLRCVLGTLVVDDARRPRGGVDGGWTADRWVAQMRPGVIAVLHEGTPERQGVIRTVDRLLHGLRRRGLSSLTVSQLCDAAASR